VSDKSSAFSLETLFPGVTWQDREVKRLQAQVSLLEEGMEQRIKEHERVSSELFEARRAHSRALGAATHEADEAKMRAQEATERAAHHAALLREMTQERALAGKRVEQAEAVSRQWQQRAREDMQLAAATAEAFASKERQFYKALADLRVSSPLYREDDCVAFVLSADRLRQRVIFLALLDEAARLRLLHSPGSPVSGRIELFEDLEKRTVGSLKHAQSSLRAAFVLMEAHCNVLRMRYRSLVLSTLSDDDDDDEASVSEEVTRLRHQPPSGLVRAAQLLFLKASQTVLALRSSVACAEAAVQSLGRDRHEPAWVPHSSFPLVVQAVMGVIQLVMGRAVGSFSELALHKVEVLKTLRQSILDIVGIKHEGSIEELIKSAPVAAVARLVVEHDGDEAARQHLGTILSGIDGAVARLHGWAEQAERSALDARDFAREHLKGCSQGRALAEKVARDVVSATRAGAVARYLAQVAEETVSEVDHGSVEEESFDHGVMAGLSAEVTDAFRAVGAIAWSPPPSSGAEETKDPLEGSPTAQESLVDHLRAQGELLRACEGSEVSMVAACRAIALVMPFLLGRSPSLWTTLWQHAVDEMPDVSSKEAVEQVLAIPPPDASSREVLASAASGSPCLLLSQAVRSLTDTAASVKQFYLARQQLQALWASQAPLIKPLPGTKSVNDDDDEKEDDAQPSLLQSPPGTRHTTATAESTVRSPPTGDSIALVCMARARDALCWVNAAPLAPRLRSFDGRRALSQLSETERELESCKVELRNALSARERADTLCREAESSAAAANARANAAELEAQASRDARSEAETRASVSSEDAERAHQAVSDANERAKRAQADSQTARERAEKLEGEVVRLRGRLKKAEEAIGAGRTALEEAVREREGVVEAADAVRKEVAGLERERGMLKETQTSLESKIAMMEAELRQSRSNEANAIRRAEAAEAATRAASETAARATTAAADAASTTAAKEAELRDKEAEISKLRNAARTAVTSAKRASEEVHSKASASLAQAQERIHKLEAELGEACSVQEVLRKESEGQRAALLESQQQVRASTKELASLQDRAKELMEQLGTSRERCKELEGQCAASLREVSALRSKLDAVAPPDAPGSDHGSGPESRDVEEAIQSRLRELQEQMEKSSTDAQLALAARALAEVEAEKLRGECESLRLQLSQVQEASESRMQEEHPHVEPLVETSSPSSEPVVPPPAEEKPRALPVSATEVPTTPPRTVRITDALSPSPVPKQELPAALAGLSDDELRQHVVLVRQRLAQTNEAIKKYKAMCLSLKEQLDDSKKHREEAEHASSALQQQIGLLTEHFSRLQTRLAAVVDFAKRHGVEIPISVLAE
jgi:hypothetical protein